jgi:hypothetical protein
MQFFILYENNGRLTISNPNSPGSEWIEDFQNSSNTQRLVSDFEFLAENYFAHPKYFRIDNKPVVRFDYTVPFRGDIAGVFGEVRDAVKKKGYDVYLVNDLMGRSISPYDTDPYGAHLREIGEVCDAIGASGFPQEYDDLEKDAQLTERVYNAWSQYAKSHGKGFIPGVCPGHRGSPPWYVPPSYVPWRTSPERPGRQIKLAKEYSTLKTCSVISFNEWYLGHQVEPSKEEGFNYLEAVRDNI